MRRAARQDLPHSEIVNGLRARQIFVLQTFQLGDGTPDLFGTRDGVWWKPMEIKRPGRKHTKAQTKLATTSRIYATRPDGSRYWIDVPPAPIPVVETLQQALALFGLE